MARGPLGSRWLGRDPTGRGGMPRNTTGDGLLLFGAHLALYAIFVNARRVDRLMVRFGKHVEGRSAHTPS